MVCVVCVVCLCVCVCVCVCLLIFFHVDFVQLVSCDVSDVIFLSLFVFVDVVSRNICFELFR